MIRLRPKFSRVILGAFFSLILIGFASSVIAEADTKTMQMMDDVVRKAKTVTTYIVDVKESVSSRGQT
ncbi:MAG: hypothetical protein HY801_06505, partial [Candidatus Lindowbacteria bacterium]|nr:hypothetical protein [Candidatus Lindowbacteria bacterium]